MPSVLEKKATEYLKADGISTAVLVLNLRFRPHCIGCIFNSPVNFRIIQTKRTKRKSAKPDKRHSALMIRL